MGWVNRHKRECEVCLGEGGDASCNVEETFLNGGRERRGESATW